MITLKERTADCTASVFFSATAKQLLPININFKYQYCFGTTLISSINNYPSNFM